MARPTTLEDIETQVFRHLARRQLVGEAGDDTVLLFMGGAVAVAVRSTLESLRGELPEVAGEIVAGGSADAVALLLHGRSGAIDVCAVAPDASAGFGVSFDGQRFVRTGDAAGAEAVLAAVLAGYRATKGSPRPSDAVLEQLRAAGAEVRALPTS